MSSACATRSSAFAEVEDLPARTVAVFPFHGLTSTWANHSGSSLNSISNSRTAWPSTKTLTDPAGAEQAAFGAQSPGYFGSGACGNTYEHRLYALGVEQLNPANGSTASGVRTALQGSTDILGETFVRLQSRDYCE